MEGRKNGNKQVQCATCRKVMRSDHLKRHFNTHEENTSTRHSSKRIKSQETKPTLEDVEKEMIQNRSIYEENISLGERVSQIFSAGGIPEESLSSEHHYCLDLYRKHRGLLAIKDVVLRKWQSSLLDLLEEPSEREIIWIVGTRGNEGKTFIQSYIESRHGYEKVALLDLDGRSQDIYHSLSKRPLEATSIFLFNISKDCKDTENSYRVLESIKDGRAMTKKYDSKMLHFKTPNVVMVFSNAPPDPARLSRDRWCVLQITGKETELKTIELDIIKRKKDGDVFIDDKGYVNPEICGKLYDAMRRK